MLTKGLCPLTQNTIPISTDPTNWYEIYLIIPLTKVNEPLHLKVYMHDVVEIKRNHFFI